MRRGASIDEHLPLVKEILESDVNHHRRCALLILVRFYRPVAEEYLRAGYDADQPGARCRELLANMKTDSTAS